MLTFLKKFLHNKFSLIFFVLLLAIGGGLLFSIPVGEASPCTLNNGETACETSSRLALGNSGGGSTGSSTGTGSESATGSTGTGSTGTGTGSGATGSWGTGSGSGSSGTGMTGSGSGTGMPPASSTSIEFANPLQYGTVEGVLDSILDTLRSIIVILSLVFIVIGAILYITSAGNDKQMTMAKGAITAAMIGLAIGLAAPSFLKEIGTVLGWDASVVNQDAVDGAQTLSQIARNVLDFLLSIVGILAIIMLVVGGIMYLTAAGNEDQLDSGKKIVKYSIIGIAVALASLVIVSQIANFFT